MVLENLEWRALVPTCTEILKLLLCGANPGCDFTIIISKTNDFIFMSLLEYEMTGFRYSSITLASLMCALDDLGYQGF
jgi:hypothetical protein